MGVKCKCNSKTPPPLERRRRRLGIINEVLPDDILVEILGYLPCQSAVKCKLVCKRWLSLISTSNFISCSISRQIQQQQDDERYPIWKLIAHGRYLFLTSQHFKSDFSFSFLPYDTSSYLDPEFQILASSDDLFLCCTRLPIMTSHFICNPSTKEWFGLPQLPSSTLLTDHCVYGFTHKPYYHVQERRVLVDSSCRFCVVRLKTAFDVQSYPFREASEFEVDVFSSETWQWTTCVMHFSHPTTPWSCISRNGLLYWLCLRGQVIVHEPYNNKVCCVVLRPPDEDVGLGWYKFSVSQGSLLAFDRHCGTIRVWELQDEDCDGHQPKWRFMTRFDLSYSRAIAVHPNDRNMIYCYAGSEGIETLNLRTGKLKPKYVQGSVASSEMVVFKAPCWPTPVSALLNQRG